MQEELEEIKKAYLKYIDGEMVANKQYDGSYYCCFYVSKNKNERYNTYYLNDILVLRMSIFKLINGYKLEVDNAYYRINPIKNPFMYYENRKIKGLRSGFKQDFASLLDYLDKGFKYLNMQLKDDLKNGLIKHTEYKDYFNNDTSHDLIVERNIK